MTKPARQKVSQVVCALCGREFATSAEHEEHRKFVHNTMDKKINVGGHGEKSRDIEPADNEPTTELPPGAEENVNLGGSRGASTGKSKSAGR